MSDITISHEVEMKYHNFYRCPTCLTEWDDQWDSKCNDQCPNCEAEIEPYKSEDISTNPANLDDDEFQCEQCKGAFDIKDSVSHEDKLYCPACSKHSVNCYFCYTLFDERNGMPADQWNNNDGGTICPACYAEKAKAETDLQEPPLVHCQGCGKDILNIDGCPNCGTTRYLTYDRNQ